MLHSRVVSVVLASGLVLGSAGMALAKVHHGDNSYQQFLDGTRGTSGTVVIQSNNKPASNVKNPFAIDGGVAGTPVSASHIATAKDMATNRVAHDQFR